MTETQLPKPIIPSQVTISVLEGENGDDAIDNPERIPFTKCTHHNKYLESDKQAKFLNRNKENRESPKRVSSPRNKVRQPLENADSGSTNTQSDIPCDRPVTPTPETSETTPLTPTANLKMLFSAVSPELRNREKGKGLFMENQNEEDSKLEPLNLDSELAASQSDPDFNDWKPGSRKEKSLGLLCQKFLQRYPEYPFPGQLIEISLDEISKDLNVERRRIYDIVNVLESVEIVSRVAKNKYAWHGKTNLVNTLAKLKALGEAEGFSEQIIKIKDYELTRELDEQNGRPSSSLPPFNLDIDNPSLALLRKDKSLGIMSQKFLMLFLVSKPRMVNLDLAAKILIGDPNIDRTENAKFKTKIRRLYDIANILATLDLIRKIRITEIRDRKPTYQYVGPAVDHINDLNVSYNDHYHRPSSRHSMLDCVKNNNNAADFIKSSGLQPVKSEDMASNQGCEAKRKQVTRKSMPRHSSFDQICQVAETERKRLYDSMSQPASPTEKISFDDFPKSLSQEEPAKMEQMVAKNEKRNSSKRIYVVQQSGSHFQVVQQNPKIKSGCSTILEDKVISTFVPKQPNSTSDSKDSTSQLRPEKIIIKTKQPASMPLTKDQIDAVLKSLKVPVPVKKNEESKDVATNVSTAICIKTDLDKTPECQVIGNKRVNTNQIGEQEPKRFRIEYPSPPTDDDEHQPRKKPDVPVKYSPQKSLTAELMSAQSPAVIANQNILLSNAKNLTGSEMDLAVPFSENEDSCDSSLVHGSTSQVIKDMSKSVQKIAVQFPNQEPTILQLPFVQMQSPSSSKDTRPAPHSAANGLSQTMKIIQGVPMSATGVSGQPINFMVPVTFSPPLTPSSGPTSPNIFSFPSQSPQNVNYNSMQLLPQNSKYPNVVSTACSVVHSSPSPGIVSVSVPQLVTPTERPLMPPSSFFGNTPGGLIPLSTISAITGNSTKEVFPTARKLDLPDISA